MQLTKSKIFLAVLIAFIIGVAIRSFFVVDQFYVFCIMIFGILLLIISKKTRIIGLLIVITALGIFRYELSLPKSVITYDQKSTFVGTIIKEPDERISNIKYTVKRSDQNSIVLITIGLYPRYDYGDELEVTCKLQQPENFEGFAYDRYLARYDIYSVCYFPKIKLIEKDQGSFVMSKMLSVKSKLKTQINKNLQEPQASLFSAIILGSRRGIPQELYDKFASAGAAHLIAISGLHITIITAILMSILSNLYISRKNSFYLITLMLIVYLVIIGFPASAMRASIMAWMMLLAYQLGRLNTSARALVFVATVMVLINPKILRDDIGFQLSFLAVLGIIYFSPYFDKWLEKLPKILGIKSILIMTFAAQVMTLPVVLYNFGRLSIISPVTNILLLPVLPYLMIISFITLITSLLLSTLLLYNFIAVSLNLLWSLPWLFLTYIIKVIDLLAKVPLASVDFKISGVVVIALFLMIGLFLNKRRPKTMLRPG
ncbi:competence protein ComEC family protein [Patescibacteria group bacterium]|nr:competence protein ComEC family protein [Patescibacteria group bacterium]